MGSTEFSIQFRFEYIGESVDDSVHQPVMEKIIPRYFEYGKLISFHM